VSRAADCYRLSGGGNDFLALVEPSAPPAAERIRAWCRRGLSLGADGLFTLWRTPQGVRMDYYNADGRAADLCLNGTRCAVRLAAHLGWHEGETTVLTGAGEITGRVAGDLVRLDLAPPTAPPVQRVVEVSGVLHRGWFVTVGVPQFVLSWPESLAAAPVLALGSALRRHPDFGSAGTNVMFARFLPPARMEIRSYERGVEAETLACGTGVLAAAAVALAQGRLELPLVALTGGGCEFEVDGEQGVDGKLVSWSLAGDARLLARVEPMGDADRVPAPPTWT
jgi:diaminopimelate epimerase